MSCSRVIFLFWGTFLLSAINGHSQITTNFTRISVGEGLSNISIRDIAEDKQGMMWFCTEDGLNRFDSYQFKVFRHDRNNANSLIQSKTNCIIQDRDGIFWIGSAESGLSSYNDQFKTFTNYKTDISSTNSLPGNRITSLEEGPNGRIIIGTLLNGLAMFNKVKGTFKSYRMTPPMENVILDIYVSRSKEIWVLTGLGLLKYDVPSDAFLPVRPDHGLPHFGSEKRLLISEDREGNIWYGSLNGFWKYDPIKKIHTHIDITKLTTQLKSPVIYQVLQNREGKFFLASPNGIYNYIPETSTIHLMQSSSYQYDEVVFEEVNVLFEDKHGLLWAGTQYGGLLKINLTQPGFMYYGHKPKSPVPLSKSVIRSLFLDSDENIWVGNMAGELVRINPKEQSVFPYNYPNPQAVTSIFEDSGGTMWIGTWEGGLYRMEKAIGRLNPITFDRSDHEANLKIQAITADGFGNLWVGTEMGINLYDPESGKASVFLWNEKNYHGPFNSVQSNAIHVDHWGQVWVGTFEGLFRMIPDDPELNFFNTTFETVHYSDQLIDDRVTVVNYDEEYPDQLLVGTYSQGFNILKIDPAQKEIEVSNYNQMHGLSSNVVYGIQRDRNGYIWVSTNHGLSQFDPLTENFTNYYESDGLQANQFFWGAFAKGSRDELIFGGLNGFNVIDAGSVAGDSSNAPVIFTELRISNIPVATGEEVDGRVILEKDISYLDEIRLSYDHDMFSLHFSSPHHVLPHQNQYAYRVLGFKDEWIYTSGNDRSITLTNLDHGTYTIEVKASNYQGKWLQEPSRIKVIIETPWWSTVPFNAFLILLLGVTVFGAVKWKLKNSERSKEKLVAIVKEKTEEIMEKNARLKDLNQELIDNLDEKLKVIEKLKLTQNQLIESEKMASIGVLTAGLAHELNNPLSYIGGIVEPIKMDLEELKPALSKKEYEQHKEIFDEIENLLEGMQFGVLKAAEIIRNLMEISPKNQEDKLTEIDLNEMINATTKLINNAKKDVDITTDLKEELRVTGNKLELNQVLINIIQNACDAIPEDREGKIDVTGFSENGNVIVKIKDNGTGIDEKLANQIYEPFFTTKGPGKGTGLGLYISYSVIKKHNGSLVATRNIHETGTTFTITVPKQFKHSSN